MSMLCAQPWMELKHAGNHELCRAWVAFTAASPFSSAAMQGVTDFGTYASCVKKIFIFKGIHSCIRSFSLCLPGVQLQDWYSFLLHLAQIINTLEDESA